VSQRPIHERYPYHFTLNRYCTSTYLHLHLHLHLLLHARVAGAKILEWYNFGPIGDAFAMIGMHEKNHSLFHWIATANRMIADAEDLLLPGNVAPSKVAILYPRSSWIWDNATSMHSGSPGTLPPACVATVDLYCGFAGGRADMCSTCIDAWPAQIAAAGCPARPAVLAYCTSISASGPHGGEDQGSSDMVRPSL
jgi:hypothetical protein